MEKKSCFVLLLANGLRQNYLNTCLNNLYHNYLHEFPVDVIIFHENGFSDYNKTFVKNILRNINIIFKQIEFNKPKIIIEDKNFKPKWCEGYWGAEKCLSYGGMCTFFAFDIFNYLIEMGYDYYARLDDDSSINTKINYNIFKHMQDNDLVYGYVMQMWEAPHVVNGLFDFINTNINKNKIVNKDYEFTEKTRLSYYYNNFEIVDINKYMTNTIKDISIKIHESGNIYYQRWGDAPIRTILLNMLFDKNKIKKFIGFNYSHNKTYNSECRELQE